MKEIVLVKNYMLRHHYKSVIFVLDPPHSRRIKFLAKFVSNYDDVNLSCIVIRSDIKWWDQTHYDKDVKARRFVKSKMIKLVHNLIAYGVFHKLGLLEVVKNDFGSFIH